MNPISYLTDIERHKNTPLELAGIEAIVFIFIFGGDGAFSELITSAHHRWGIYALLLVLGLGVWTFRLIHFPSIRKNKTGILIAIRSENEDQRTRVKDDFVKKLNDQIHRGELRNKVNIQLFSEAKAKQLCKWLDEYSKHSSEVRTAELNKKPIPKYAKKRSLAWERYQKKLNYKLCIWGSIKERLHEGEPSYELELECLTTHAPVATEVSMSLSKDMLSAFPRDFVFSKRNEFEKFNLSAVAVYFAIKYIIGISAAISGSTDFAIQQLKELLSELRTAPNESGISYIKKNTPIWLSDAYCMKGHELEIIGDFSGATLSLMESARIDPTSYQAWLTLGRMYFNERKLDESWASIMKARDLSNNHYACAYSIAFLQTYRAKNFEKAIKAYKKATANTPEGKNTVPDVLNYIADVLKKEPDKIQLHFAIGYIKYKALKNGPDALSHFEEFLTASDGHSEFEILQALAASCVADIKASIGY